MIVTTGIIQWSFGITSDDTHGKVCLRFRMSRLDYCHFRVAGLLSFTYWLRRVFGFIAFFKQFFFSAEVLYFSCGNMRGSSKIRVFSYFFMRFICL